MEKLSLPEPLQGLLDGLEHGALTNFFGEPASGKTNICMLAAVDCVAKGGTVAYVDTEGGFSFERFSQVCPGGKEALKRIAMVRPQDFADQGRAIRALKNKQSDMIVVDSAVALFRLECSETEATFEAGKELSRQLSVLNNIAISRNIPIIITSHSFRRKGGEQDVVGGDVIKYWSKSLILLEKTGRASERKATIVKHRWLPEERNVKFNIVQEGIKPAGFRIF